LKLELELELGTMIAACMQFLEKGEINDATR
jgi:hypothetical protein